MMASTSNPMQHQLRNWLDLPSDVTTNILSRVGMFDVLENVDKVCTSWHKICKNPAMWRVVNMKNFYGTPGKVHLMFKEAVDRSQDQLVDVTISDAVNSDARTLLLLHVADRSSHLKRLELICSYDLLGRLSDALMKFPLLEELNIYYSRILAKEIESIGHYCPMLKTLKLNHIKVSLFECNYIAIAIGKNLHGLRHLELIGNKMKNIGLQAIIDNCLHLQTLDLRRCPYIRMKGELEEKCTKQIKHLKLPNDYLEDELSDMYNFKFDDALYDIFDDYQ